MTPTRVMLLAIKKVTSLVVSAVFQFHKVNACAAHLHEINHELILFTMLRRIFFLIANIGYVLCISVFAV
jgi:hypothetical protein